MKDLVAPSSKRIEVNVAFDVSCLSGVTSAMAVFNSTVPVRLSLIVGELTCSTDSCPVPVVGPPVLVELLADVDVVVTSSGLHSVVWCFLLQLRHLFVDLQLLTLCRPRQLKHR